MSLMVVGSMAFDDVRLPDGKLHKDVLGGSCTYFSYAASFFTRGAVRLVGVVGGDFGRKNVNLLKKRPIDLEGLQIVPEGKTFRWAGTYAANLNDRTTDDLQFGVLADFDPVLPSAYRDSSHVFLACAQPELQLKVLGQMRRKPLAVCDTIEVYIRNSHKPLMELLRKCDGVIVNDAEASLLCGDDNAVRCVKALLKFGPKFAVLKKGAHGALLATRDGVFPVPAFPLAKVVDPTGAGDAFAGGFMAWLSRCKDAKTDTLRQALVAGTATASLVCEGLGLSAIARRNEKDVFARARDFAALLPVPGKAF